jgi:adenosylhomocysteinase
MSDIADPALAESGRTSIAWADAQMPVLRSLRERFGDQRPLAGLTVAACLHVTAETAGLVKTLVAGGARVALCAANPLATQDGVAAALAELDDVEVFARHGEDLDTYAGHVADVLDRAPRITIDDGADLLVTLHAARPDLLKGLLGGTEETTSGLVRLRAMQSDGRLLCPVLAVNEARAERVFNDHYGTAQSTLDGILRATNLLLAGRTVVVLGYGPTGRGIALRSRGAGAQVVVCEIDPIAGLDARMEGFEVMPSLQAATRGDIFITVTGAPAVLGRDHFERMKDGAVLANAGHFDVEIDLGALRELSGAPGRRVRPLVEQYTLPDGRSLNLLASGRVVNLAAGEGHPASVMDLSFALQALSVEHLAAGEGKLPTGVQPVPDDIDREVARLKLASLGVQLDQLTAEQRRYRRSWE